MRLSEGTGLDTHAKFGGLLAGVRIEVVGGTAIELVAHAKLAAEVDAQRGDSHSDRKPSDHAKSGAFFFFARREGFDFGGHRMRASYLNDNPSLDANFPVQGGSWLLKRVNPSKVR